MSKKKRFNIGKKAKTIATKPFVMIYGLIKSIIRLPANTWAFLKSVYRELKLVEWLSRRNTAKWSSAVILTAFLVGGAIVLVDLVLFKLRNLLFKL